MTNMSKPRIRVPDTLKVGDIIDVKVSITHVMETGNRRDADGRPIPRNIVNTVTARYAGAVVFKLALGSGMAANPLVTFPMRVSGAGTLQVTWADDQGGEITEGVVLNIVG